MGAVCGMFPVAECCTWVVTGSAGVRPCKLTLAAGAGKVASLLLQSVQVLNPATRVNAQDGYTVRDQVMCDLLHLFDVTLRTYKPLQAAGAARTGTAAPAHARPGSPAPAGLPPA